MAAPLMTLEQFVDEQVSKRYGTASALAGRIGMSFSAFSRSVRAGSLSTENLLRLAMETGTPPSDLLRIARKEHVAHLIETLYGKGAAAPPNGDLRTLAELWPDVQGHTQQALLVLIRQLAKPATSAKRRTA